MSLNLTISKIDILKFNFYFKFENLKNELYYEGYNMTIRSTLRVRQIFFNMNSTLLNLDINEISNKMAETWNHSLNTKSDVVISVKIINQKLYYDEKFGYVNFFFLINLNFFTLSLPLIGIKYVVSINNVDPDDLYLSDPLKITSEKYFHPLKVHIPFRPLLARR